MQLSFGGKVVEPLNFPLWSQLMQRKDAPHDLFRDLAMAPKCFESGWGGLSHLELEDKVWKLGWQDFLNQFSTPARAMRFRDSFPFFLLNEPQDLFSQARREQLVRKVLQEMPLPQMLYYWALEGNSDRVKLKRTRHYENAQERLDTVDAFTDFFNAYLLDPRFGNFNGLARNTEYFMLVTEFPAHFFVASLTKDELCRIIQFLIVNLERTKLFSNSLLPDLGVEPESLPIRTDWFSI
jgi:hypothetical protein